MKMILAILSLTLITSACDQKPSEINKSENALMEALKKRDQQMSVAWELNQRFVDRANVPSEMENLKIKYPTHDGLISPDAKHAVFIESTYIYRQATKCRFGDERLTWEDISYEVCYEVTAEGKDCITEVNPPRVDTDPCR